MDILTCHHLEGLDALLSYLVGCWLVECVTFSVLIHPLDQTSLHLIELLATESNTIRKMPLNHVATTSPRLVLLMLLHAQMLVSGILPFIVRPMTCDVKFDEAALEQRRIDSRNVVFPGLDCVSER